jgi:hypothetical protein
LNEPVATATTTDGVDHDELLHHVGGEHEQHELQSVGGERLRDSRHQHDDDELLPAALQRALRADLQLGDRLRRNDSRARRRGERRRQRPRQQIPQSFTTGIGFCLTGGGSSTDNTNAATGVYVTILYK